MKALGTDGFSALFFQRYWHIVGEGVSNFCLNILNNDLNMVSMNITNIVRISKTPIPLICPNFGLLIYVMLFIRS